MGPSSRFSGTGAPSDAQPVKLRSACDMCHQTKVKCSGPPRCDECTKLGSFCRFSASSRIGRPKGARNKNTLDRIRNSGPLEGSDSTGYEQNHGDTFVASPHNPTASLPRSNFGDLTESSNPLGQQWLEAAGYGKTGAVGSGQDIHQNSTLASLDDISMDLNWDDPFMPSTPSLDLDFSSTNSSGSNPLFLDMQLPSSSSNQSISNASRRSSGSSCNCLQEHTQLLCRIKVLNRQQPIMAVDTLFMCSDQVLECFASMLNCPICLDSYDHEVLTLAVFNIRIIILKFCDVVKRMDGRKSSSNYSSAIDLTRLNAGQLSTNHNRDVTQPRCRSNPRPPSSAKDEGDESLHIGRFQMTGSDGQSVISFLMLQKLTRLRDMLVKTEDRCAGHSRPSLREVPSSTPNGILIDTYSGRTNSRGMLDSLGDYHLKVLLESMKPTIDILIQKLSLYTGEV